MTYPHYGIPLADYEEKKLPYVRRQFGVLDTTIGGVIICKSREHALKAIAADSRFKLMSRTVSDWMEDWGE